MKTQLFISLSVISLCLLAGCGKEEEPDTSGYKCVNGTCVQVQSGATSNTLAECNSTCLVPDAQIIVFFTQDCSCGNISASATDSIGTSNFSISPYWGTQSPNCGAGGYITFDVKSGSVFIDIASGGGLYVLSWSKTLDVVAGSCTKLRLNCDETTTLL